MQPSFLPATTLELPMLLRLMVAFNEEGGYPAGSARTKKLLQEFLAEPSLGRIWLMEIEGKTAGYLVLCHCFSFEHGGKDAFLDEIYVSPEFRRKGVGAAALAFLQDYAVVEGIRAIHLEVEEGNRAARSVYEKAGFIDPKRPLMSWKP